MELTLYDTLTRAKRPFAPIDPARVRMYVCGPTVYDFAHIGNARPVIVFDVLFRLLRHLYGADHVTYVRNITDVDDKINARAAQEYPDLPLNEAIRRVTEQTERQFHADVAALGCLRPTIEPRATEHIVAMKTLIERLVAAGSAYVAEDHVLFSVASMPDYGQAIEAFARRDDRGSARRGRALQARPHGLRAVEALEAGRAGVAVAVPASRRPGRPGWHIECSAMAWKHLGETFDIHGGGIDLVFPHHENEIAQSRCSFHTPVMANYWMHNGFLQVEGEKMAKSGGQLRHHPGVCLPDWHGQVLRFNMLRTHYRQPIDWTESGLEQSWATLEDWWSMSQHRFTHLHHRQTVLAALSDDLNTPKAIAELHVHAGKSDQQRGRGAARGRTGSKSGLSGL